METHGTSTMRLHFIQSEKLTTDHRVNRILTSFLSSLYLSSARRSVKLDHSSTYTQSEKQ